MLGCKTSASGPWARPNGKELGLRIIHLLKGERVLVETEQSVFHFNEPGSFPLGQLATASRYRVCKEVDEGVEGSPTIVEVILNG